MCPTINNSLGIHNGKPTAVDEKFLSNLSNYHLWELSLLRSHVESQVVSAVEAIFKSSVSTTINASSNDTSFKNNLKTASVELTIPPNVNAISDMDEDMLIDGNEEFAILSKNLAHMRTTSMRRRNRIAKHSSKN